MRTLVAATAAAAGLLALVVSGAGCQRAKAETGAAPRKADTAVVKVVVSGVTERPFEDWGSFSADLRGVEDANLVAPVQGGRVTMVREVGARVRAGEALCAIDSARYEAALQAANAQVEVTKGDLERARINVEKGSIGRAALDAANLAYQNARVLQAAAQRAYEDCRCQAPFDGVLVSRAIERYQTLNPGVPTVRISRIDRLEAVVAIPESEAFSYSEGMKTEFSLLQDPKRTYAGRLSSLDRAVDPRSRTVTARIVVTNADGALKPGMVGRARILRRTYAKAVVVPATALLRLQSGVAAMVAVDGVARQQAVTVAATNEDSALISSGLKPGDQLIVSGAFQLTNGTRVQF